MKLSNLFKAASPFLSNLLTLLIAFTLFLQSNQDNILSLWNTGSTGQMTAGKILTTIVFIGGLLKAFTAQGGANGSIKQFLINFLKKAAESLSTEPLPYSTGELDNQSGRSDSNGLPIFQHMPEPPAPK